MNILVTGYRGYIGSLLIPILLEEGYRITGIDTCWHENLISTNTQPHLVINKDIRHLDIECFNNIDCVIHLAALCNDPLGELNEKATYDINYHASIDIAKLAKKAGVKRFIYASSCSLYGGSGGRLVDESADFTPLTHYAKSKINVEKDIYPLADDVFCVTCLRLATAYGFAPMLRGDLVINNLTYYALTTGKVYLKSQGLAWRPFIHVEDIARVINEFIKAPTEIVNHNSFNIGCNKENYTINEIAEIVKLTIPDSNIEFASNAFIDERNYKVDFTNFKNAFSDFKFNWTVHEGIKQLKEKFIEHDLINLDIDSQQLNRVERLNCLIKEGLLDQNFFWKSDNRSFV